MSATSSASRRWPRPESGAALNQYCLCTAGRYALCGPPLSGPGSPRPSRGCCPDFPPSATTGSDCPRLPDSAESTGPGDGPGCPTGHVQAWGQNLGHRHRSRSAGRLSDRGHDELNRSAALVSTGLYQTDRTGSHESVITILWVTPVVRMYSFSASASAKCLYVPAWSRRWVLFPRSASPSALPRTHHWLRRRPAAERPGKRPRLGWPG